MKKRRQRSSALLILFSLCLLASAVIKAQQNTPQTTVTPIATVAPSPSALPSPNAQTSDQRTQADPIVAEIIEGHLELDDIVSVRVDNLDNWADTNDATKLVPYINGRPIRGNYPEAVHASRNNLSFHLEITRDNREIWTDLLGAPTSTTRPVAFSVGLENQSPFDSKFDQKNRVHLTVISPVYGVIALLVVLATLTLFLWLARKTNIIREPGPRPGGGQLKPYNLGRTQMAFWFFLVYVSYLVIWLITNSLDTITASLLGLMGISAGTALSEALIDSEKHSTKSKQLQVLTAEQETLEQTIVEIQSKLTALGTAPPTTPEEMTMRYELSKQLVESRTRLNQVGQQLTAITPAASSNVSVSFQRDLLTDAGGYSFHRFQIFAWTIVLGIIFVSSVYNNLAMPEFSTTLLGLMGISSGTYIGFKFPEQK